MEMGRGLPGAELDRAGDIYCVSHCVIFVAVLPGLEYAFAPQVRRTGEFSGAVSR